MVADISTKKKRRRIITAVAAGVILFIWLLYLFLTSSFFLKTTLLPVLSRKLGTSVHAQEIHLSPLSGTIEIKYLTLGDAKSQILECRHIYLDASLLSLPGKVDIASLNISDVKVSLKQDAAGNWNLPLLKQLLEDFSKKDTENQENDDSEFELPKEIVLPFQLKVSNISIANIDFHAESAAAANPFRTDISNFNLSLKNLVPASHADLKINAKFNVKYKNVDIDDGRFNCHLQTDLNAGSMPEKLSFNNSLKIISGKLNLIKIDNNRLEITSNLSFNGNKFNISSLDMDYYNAQNICSSTNLTASGSLNPLAVNFKLKAPQIPETMLNLVENCTGYNGLGYAEASLLMDISYQKRILSTLSELHLKHHIAGKETSRLPEVYLDLAENISIDFNKKNLNVKNLKVNIRGIHSGALKVSLSEPFSWNWTTATSSSSIHPSIFLKADNIRLSVLNPLTAAHGFSFGKNGCISGIMSTSFNRKNHCVRLNSKFVGNNLNLSFPGYKISAVSLVAKLTASSQDMKNISFSPTLLVQHRGKTVVQTTISGALDLPSKSLMFNVNVSGANQHTLNVLPDVVQNLEVMRELLPRLSPFDLKVKTNGNLNFKKQTLNIAKAEVKVDRQKQGNLKINFLAPWPLDISGMGEVMPKPMNANVVFEDMDVRFVNMFLPDSQKINSGHIYTKLKTRLDITKEKLNTQGLIKLVSVGMRTGNLEFKNLALATDVNVSMDQWTKLNIKHFAASVYNGKNIAFQARNTSDFDFNAGNMNIKTQITDLTRETVKILQPDFPVKFTLNGNSTFSMRNNYSYPLIQARFTAKDITSPKIKTPLEATFNIDVFPKKNMLMIKKIDGIIKHDQNRLTDFRINGNLATPLDAGKSRINLNSNKLDLTLLEKILSPSPLSSASKTSETSVNQPLETSEPVPLKLNANAKIYLNLKNITYGPDIAASCSKSVLSIKKNQLTINPLNIKLNDSDISLKGTVNVGAANGYPYAVEACTKQLKMGPILRAFAENQTKSINGQINNVSIKLTGKGFTRKNLDSKLKGTVKFNVRNLSIPDSLKSIRTIRIILLPVESFAQIINYLPTLGTASFSKSINNARDIYNDVDNLRLKQGEVDLKINSGIVNIEKFHFSGDFIQKMDFTGYVPINPDAPMKLVSVLDVYYLAVPLDINGTFNSPLPNVRKMVTNFLPRNIYNIMKSAPVRSIIKSSVKETGTLLKKTEKMITDGIFGPTSPKQDDSKQKENSNRIEQLYKE